MAAAMLFSDDWQMSDFLSSLAAKNLSLTDTIQPRVASLFEPVQTASGLFPEPHGDAKGLQAELASEATAREAPDQPSARPFAKRFGSLDENQRTALLDTELLPPRPRNLSQETLTNLTAARVFGDMLPGDSTTRLSLQAEGRVRKPVLAPKEAVSISPGQHFKQEASEPAPAEFSQPAKLISLPIVNQPTEDLPAPRENFASQKEVEDSSPFRRKTQQHQRARETMSEPIVSERFGSTAESRQLANVKAASQPPAVVAKPLVKPYVEPTAFKRAEQLAPTPTIQVTIGRIEVRATPPATQPPKPRTASPVMSLDEYLRLRQGGGA
jgi:hypothetical protein